jgi:hypothetical protein
MRVLILRTTMADGRLVRAGSVEDLTDRDAMELLQLGKAVEAVEVETVADDPVSDQETEPVKRKSRKRGAD